MLFHRRHMEAVPLVWANVLIQGGKGALLVGMKIPSLPTRYAAPSISIHWLMALIVLALFISVSMFEDAPDGPGKLQWIFLHKSLGITILGLLVVRVLLRGVFPAPALPSGMPKWQVGLAHALHAALYLAMLGIPLSGWLMSDAKGYHPQLFGFDVLPVLLAPNEALAHTFKEVHEAGASVLLALLGVHVAAAVYHHVRLKDDILRRMLPVWLAKVLPVAVLVVVPFAVQAESLPVWSLSPATSSITWKASLSGNTVQGSFRQWAADVAFDPTRALQSHIKVTIDPTSVSTNDAQRDESLKGADFFNVAAYPKITFTSESIKQTGTPNGNTFVAVGRLNMGGVEKPFALPFQVNIAGNKATAEATFTVSRSAFHIGTGPWQGNASLADLVQVRVRIAADRT